MVDKKFWQYSVTLIFLHTQVTFAVHDNFLDKIYEVFCILFSGAAYNLSFTPAG